MSFEAKSHVLVVEPDWSVCMNVIQALHHLGHIAIVESTETAFQDASRPMEIDLVMLGLGHDNAENMRRLAHARQQFQGSTIASLCPHMRSRDRCDLLNAGLDFILEKPMSVDECASTIRAILRRRDMNLN